MPPKELTEPLNPGKSATLPDQPAPGPTPTAPTSYTYCFVFPLPSVTTDDEEADFQKRVKNEYAGAEYSSVLKDTIINEHLKRHAKVECENTLKSLRNATIEIFESFFASLGTHEPCDILKFTSCDNDELFMCVEMSEALAEKLADMGEYPLQLSYDALADEMINVKITTGVEGVVPTYAKYDAKHKKLLKTYCKVGSPDEPAILREADRIRLLYDKVTDNFDLGELTRLGLLLHHYPTHQRQHLEFFDKMFCNCMYVFSPKIPVEEIRDYFGEQIAFYFLFCSMLIKAFAISTLVAIPCTVAMFHGDRISANAETDEEHARGVKITDIGKVVFTFLNIIWFTVFLKKWKQTESYYSNRWGTDMGSVGTSIQEQVNPNFRGERRPNPLDENESELRADPWKEFKGLTISMIATILFVVAVLCAIGLNQYATAYISWWAAYGPIALSVQIKVFDFVWDMIAEALTHGEQHVTQPAWDQWKAIKVFFMKFINTFTTFVWITYFQPNLFNDSGSMRVPCGPKKEPDECVGLLQYNLGLTFVTYVTFGGLDMLLPWFFMKLEIWKEARSMRKAGGDVKELGLLEAEAKMLPYTGDDASADYFQIIFPLAFILLYGPVLPICSVLCLFALTTQLRADAWKICKAYRRCYPVRAKGIGIWNVTLVGFNYLSIFNCIGLLLTQVRNLDEFFPGINGKKITVFFVLQNIFVAFKLIYDTIVPDVPHRTQLEQQRQTLQRIRMFEAEDVEFSEDIQLSATGDAGKSMYESTPPLEHDHPAFVKPMV